MADRHTVEIQALGAKGDGLTTSTDGRKLFIAGGLPSEVWEVEDGRSPILVRPHPERAEARCPHYGVCGGCVAQHMPDALYAAWKRDIVQTALSQHGLGTVAVEPLVRVPAQSRRRAVLTARRAAGGGVTIGFHGSKSHDLVGVTACAVLVPEIVRVLSDLGRVASVLIRAAEEEARLLVLATPAGLDVTVLAPDGALPAEVRSVLARIAEGARIARISVGGEPIVFRVRTVLEIDGMPVTPPPGVFAQAAAEAEAELRRLVLDGLGRAKHVADLYAGLGTFALPAARRARVAAYDSAADALAALAAAARSTPGLKPVATHVRDLQNEPLSAVELAPFDAVVFDPPRAGAKTQVERLARSKVPTLVAVSCNPQTLARDLAVLTGGGYRIDRVTPVDQFVLSDHVEVVAVLARDVVRRRPAR